MLISKTIIVTTMIKIVPLFNIYVKNDSILSLNLINHKKRNRLTKPYNSYRFVRYTGNKIGHARKVMEILNKNKPPVNGITNSNVKDVNSGNSMVSVEQKSDSASNTSQPQRSDENTHENPKLNETTSMNHAEKITTDVGSLIKDHPPFQRPNNTTEDLLEIAKLEFNKPPEVSDEYKELVTDMRNLPDFSSLGEKARITESIAEHSIETYPSFATKDSTYNASELPVNKDSFCFLNGPAVPDELSDDIIITPQDTEIDPLFPNVVGIKYKDDVVDGNQMPFKLHETQHHSIGVYDEKSGVIEVNLILTSSKNNTVTKNPNVVVNSDINYNGDGKPQRMAHLKETRYLEPTDKGVSYEIDENLTKYANQSSVYPEIIEALNASPETSKVTRKHKDDSSYFTEYGINIEDDELL